MPSDAIRSVPTVRRLNRLIHRLFPEDGAVGLITSRMTFPSLLLLLLLLHGVAPVCLSRD